MKFETAPRTHFLGDVFAAVAVIVFWGAYDLTTATSMKTSLKNRLCVLSNHLAIIPQVAHLLKRREFMLELKRGGRTRVQTELEESIALPYPSSKKKRK